uniref:Uncharacterized protein n=1 Tax=Triticum urartu TaxID=4572 RepID=A0A8R7UL40_TRIUA
MKEPSWWMSISSAVLTRDTLIFILKFSSCGVLSSRFCRPSFLQANVYIFSRPMCRLKKFVYSK